MAFIPAPTFDVRNHVLIGPLDNMVGRIVGVSRCEEGWVYEVRYIHCCEAKTMRCFDDELQLGEA